MLPTLEQERSTAAVPSRVSRITFSLQEAASFLEISPAHAWELAKLGRLPALQSEKEWVFRIEDLMEYDEQRERRRRQERESPLYKAREMIAAAGMRV